MTLLLGLPGDLVSPNHQPSHYGTKVGGPPHIPDAFSTECFSDACCGVCGDPMALIFQTHAPLDAGIMQKTITERILFLFSCLRKDCGKSAASWRVYRLQMDLKEDNHPSSKCEEVPEIKMKSEQEENSGLNLEAIRAALQQISQSKKTKAKKKKKVKPVSKKLSCPTQLPEFYLYAETEPKETPPRNLNEDKQVQTALARYQAQEGESGMVPKRVSGNQEEYEKPKFKSADGGAFYRFQKRLNLAPAQCVRYGFNEEALFPVPEQSIRVVPPCQSCGSDRVFEFQLTPHLMSAFIEAADWTEVNHENLRAHAEVFAFERDWSTVLVYTCRQSCLSTRLGTFCEHVEVYLEPQD